MSNSAELLVSQNEGTPIFQVQGGESKRQPLGFQELDHHLRPLFMAEQEIAECTKKYPGFKCFWHGNVVVLVQGLEVRKIIRPSAQQVRIMNRRLSGEDSPWAKGPEIACGQDFEPGTLVFDQEQGMVLASEFSSNKQLEADPFPIVPYLRKQSARWVLLIFDKHDRRSVIKKMILTAEAILSDPGLNKPHILIDTYLWQSKDQELLTFRTRKINLDPLRADVARAVQAASLSQDPLPGSATRWWRRLQEQVPRHGRIITVFTPTTAGAFLNMAHWTTKKWERRTIPHPLRPGQMLTLRWTLEGIKLTSRMLFNTDP